MVANTLTTCMQAQRASAHRVAASFVNEIEFKSF